MSQHHLIHFYENNVTFKYVKELNQKIRSRIESEN